MHLRPHLIPLKNSSLICLVVFSHLATTGINRSNLSEFNRHQVTPRPTFWSILWKHVLRRKIHPTRPFRVDGRSYSPRTSRGSIVRHGSISRKANLPSTAHSCAHSSLEKEVVTPLWRRYSAFAEINPATTVSFNILCGTTGSS